MGVFFSELALYVLPRAMDSLFLIMCDRRWMTSIPNGELLVFGSAMASLMYFYDKEESALGSLVKQGLGLVIGK